MANDQSLIRNFCIVAHIDHGKSTLADRILELTGAVRGGAAAQMLDEMELERERGITIKMTAVSLSHRGRDGRTYQFNLIDTPGHVDFTYEVSRSLAACEGALLVVDASQGVEAQTIANASMAMQNDLAIVPVINKIDLAVADPKRTKEEIEHALVIDASDALEVSAKSGQGVDEVLEAVVERIPPPTGDPGAPLRALIFDSHFDSYQGAVAYVRVVDGAIRKRQKIRMMATGKVYEVHQVGVFRPKMELSEGLSTGQVGFITAAMKEIGEANVGDTITDAAQPAAVPLPGYRKARPMVFSGLYPTDGESYEDLRDAIEKLHLNDASIHYEPETSEALGFGFRCGFLGLLHMEIARERLEREFGLDLILTAPTVNYQVRTSSGDVLDVSNPAELPEGHYIDRIQEPVVDATILVPSDYVGAVMTLCQDRRGTYKSTEYPSENRALIHYKLPLGEILMDFFDALKSATKGYASLDYEFAGYEPGKMVKVNILLNGEPVDALSFITHTDKAQARARGLVERLRRVVPRQQFEVRIQAAIGAKIIAAESVKPFRKHVTAKCYGGDITRKRKLLEKQKAGKKRMKSIGAIQVPQEAFLSVLRTDE
jgi:GTP-binding protein LepA